LPLATNQTERILLTGSYFAFLIEVDGILRTQAFANRKRSERAFCFRNTNL